MKAETQGKEEKTPLCYIISWFNYPKDIILCKGLWSCKNIAVGSAAEMTNCLNTYSKYTDIALRYRQILAKHCKLGQDHCLLHVVKVPD